LLGQVAGIRGDAVAAVLFLFGLGSTVGNFFSGGATDRIGPRRVITMVLTGLIGLFALVSLTGAFFSPSVAAWIIVPLIALWGFVGFSFPSAQQSLIVTLAPKLASITLSLNASAIYVGVSVGELIGSIVVAHGSLGDIGWAAAACEVIALLLVKYSARRSAVADSSPQSIQEPLSEAA